MKNTAIGLAILGVAVMIALHNRNNVNTLSTTENFGGMAVIIVLVMIGFSFVRSGEAERLRNKGRGKSPSPPKGAFQPPKGQFQGGGARPAFPGAQSSSSSFEVPEGLTKAVLGILILIVGGVSAYGAKLLLFPSDFKTLCEIESPKSAVKAEPRLNPILDKMAERFGQGRSEIDEVMLEAWESNDKAYIEYGLRPSSLAREILAATPKEGGDIAEIAGQIAEEKPATRMARLSQPKPKFGKYPQEGQFQKLLDALSKKTGMGSKALASVIVSRWKVLYSKKKQNPKYGLLWFTSTANAQVKKAVKKDDFIKRLEKIGR